MLDFLQREAIYLWYYFDIQLRQIFWYWVLGMGVGSAVSVFLKGRIHGALRTLGQKKLGYFGIFVSSVLGIASPLCMYGTIPSGVIFQKRRTECLAGCLYDEFLPAESTTDPIQCISR